MYNRNWSERVTDTKETFSAVNKKYKYRTKESEDGEMRANYHTHSRWCRHGKGEISEYIEEAIRHGLEEIAMTEHVPHEHGHSWIYWDQFPAYDEELNKVVKGYQDQIKVIKGFECEYYPEDLDAYRRFQEDYGYELLILGQHQCGAHKEIDAFSCHTAYQLHVYADAVCKGLETGLFRFLAHPDCGLNGYENVWDKECESVMAQIFQACEELKIPVEINANGVRDHRKYPCEEAFRLSKKYDLKYLVNADAHAPEYLCDDAVRKAEEFAGRLGITLCGTLSDF